MIPGGHFNALTLNREGSAARDIFERRQVRNARTLRLYSGDVATLLRERRLSDGPRLIVTPNLDHLRLLDAQRSFRRAYGAADIVLNDSRFLDRHFLRGRATCLPGSELAPQMLAHLERDSKVMVIGAPIAVRAYLLANYAHLRFSFHEPSEGYVRKRAERRTIVAEAMKCEPERILICTGAPQSEIVAHQLKRRLTHPCDILCCGGALQFLAGLQSRAPPLLQALGCEWAWRFVFERRTRRRYTADARFLFQRLREFIALRSKTSARLGAFEVELADAPEVGP